MHPRAVRNFVSWTVGILCSRGLNGVQSQTGGALARAVNLARHSSLVIPQDGLFQVVQKQLFLLHVTVFIQARLRKVRIQRDAVEYNLDEARVDVLRLERLGPVQQLDQFGLGLFGNKLWGVDDVRVRVQLQLAVAVHVAQRAEQERVGGGLLARRHARLVQAMDRVLERAPHMSDGRLGTGKERLGRGQLGDLAVEGSVGSAPDIRPVGVGFVGEIVARLAEGDRVEMKTVPGAGADDDGRVGVFLVEMGAVKVLDAEDVGAQPSGLVSETNCLLSCALQRDAIHHHHHHHSHRLARLVFSRGTLPQKLTGQRRAHTHSRTRSS